MNILVILIISCCCFAIGVKFYGRIVARWLGEDANRPTPAQEINDGTDYVPTNMNILFGTTFPPSRARVR